jgi:hypothetical protein
LIKTDSIIQEYLDHELSLIPIKKNEKKPKGRGWKKYQYNKATIEDILEWYANDPEINLAIVTGKISQVVVIDIDDPAILPELRKILPEIDHTTRVKTRKGFHYYFSLNGIIPNPSYNLFDLGIELKSNGQYVLAEPSKIDGNKYKFEIPLSKIIPYPDRAIKLDRDIQQKKQTKIKAKITAKEEITRETDKKDTPVKLQGLPAYHGKNKLPCMKQIFERDLKEGERDKSLYILYNLLLQQDNDRKYSKKLIRNKNASLKTPLTTKEIIGIFSRKYKLGCDKIRETLEYIECYNCKLRYKNGGLKMSNPLIRHIRKLPKLGSTEGYIALLLGTTYQGETVTANRVAKDTGMDYRTVSRAMSRLGKRKIFKQINENPVKLQG